MDTVRHLSYWNGCDNFGIGACSAVASRGAKATLRWVPERDRIAAKIWPLRVVGDFEQLDTSPENLDCKLNLALKVRLPACLKESAKRRTSWRVVVVLLKDWMIWNVEGVQTSL